MDEFIIGWAINTVLTLVQIILRGSPSKREQFRRALLKVRDAINVAYPDDSPLPVETLPTHKTE